MVARGHHVRVLDSLVDQVHKGPPRYLNADAEFIAGNVNDPAIVNRALESVEVVFHQAAEVGVGQSMYEIRRYVEGNTAATAVLLEALLSRREQIRKVVVASSMSIYGEGAYECAQCGRVDPSIRSNAQLQDRRWEAECPNCGKALRPVPTPEEKPLFPTSVYAVTKQDQEQLCLAIGRAYGIPTVALRYFNVYGTRQALSNPYTGVCAMFSSRLLNGRAPVIFEDGRQSRDFVHVSDIVQANLLAMENGGADYHAVNVGTGIATTIMKVAQVLSEGLGKQVEPEITGKYRAGDIRHCVADISAARKLLGYEPTVEFAQGMVGLLDWVRREAAEDGIGAATYELESRQLVR
jgi:dTDP-L-rhamnose 4-epimerase